MQAGKNFLMSKEHSSLLTRIIIHLSYPLLVAFKLLVGFVINDIRNNLVYMSLLLSISIGFYQRHF